MKTSKPFWSKDPSLEQTSIRFCCPHCYSWVRKREFEEHMELAHAQINESSLEKTQQRVK